MTTTRFWSALTRRELSWLDLILFLVLYSVADALRQQYHWRLWPFAAGGVLAGAIRSVLCMRRRGGNST